MNNSGILVNKENGQLALDNTYQNFYLTSIATRPDGTSDAAWRAGGGGFLDENGNANFFGWGCSESNMDVGYSYSNAARDPTEHGEGLQIYGADGKVIFDSNWKTMKVIHMGNAHDSYTIPVVDGKEYAVAPLNIEYTLHWTIGDKGGGFEGIIFLGLTTTYTDIKDGGITTSSFYQKLETPPGLHDSTKYATWGKPTYLILDVTHFKENIVKADIAMAKAIVAKHASLLKGE